MIVGAVGFVLSLLYMTMWSERARAGRARATYVERDVPPEAY